MHLNWVQLSSLCASSTAVVLNLCLLPIIIIYSGSYIGKYKYLLFMYSLSAIVYTAPQIFTLPTFYVRTDSLLFYATAQWLPRWLEIIAIFLFPLSYCQILIILNLSFIYRLFVLRCPENPKWFHEPRYGAVTIASSLLILLYMIASALYGAFPSDIWDQHMKNEIFNATGLSVETMGYAGAPIVLSNGDINVAFFTTVGSYAVFTIVGCSLIGYCFTNIVTAFMDRSMLSVATYKAQQRLFLLLVMQSAFPVMFTYGPTCSSCVFILLRLSAVKLTASYGALLSFAQVIDPLLSFYFIIDYRKALLAIFGYGPKVKVFEITENVTSD